MPEPDAGVPPDSHRIIGPIVQLRVVVPVAAMGKEEKMRVAELMDERGLFLVRGSIEQAAQALGVTRFSIYNYLEEIRCRAKARQWKGSER